MSRATRLGARGASLGMALSLVLAPAPGAPHALLVKSAPARRAVLSQPPDRVRLWFNERLEAAFSHVSVVDRQGTRVDLQDAGVDEADPKQLSVGLPPLPAGTYTVRFRVLSVDGHIVESAFSFTVRQGR